MLKIKNDKGVGGNSYMKKYNLITQDLQDFYNFMESCERRI